jgi:phosphomannomutase
MPSPADTPVNASALRQRAADEAKAAGISAGQVRAALDGADYFSLLEAAFALPRKPPAEAMQRLREALEGLLKIKAFSFPPPARKGKVEPVVFGTGGHRGEIGVGLTLTHVRVIVQAMLGQIESMNAAERKLHFGAETVEEVQAKGFVIGHDNRLFNPEFSFFTAHLLEQRGYRAFYAGRVASPEVSLVVPLRGWAGGLNFTPSHNPFRYGGLKFNPADGGLAGAELTDGLAAAANRLLDSLASGDWPPYEELEAVVAAQAEKVERVDLHTPYLEALRRHPVLRLDELCEMLRGLPPGEGAAMVADPVFGGAVPAYRALRPLLGEDVLSLLHTEDDPYFGGQTTEPNEETLTEARETLKEGDARFGVAIRNDPDGDRGLVGDEEGAIRMNQFAALVLRYLIDRGMEGGVATTFPTSRFGMDFARARNKQVYLTPVGFKNFRPFLLDGRAMMAYEESDGITIAGHTLDKDGILAGLLALRIVLHYQKPLSALIREIEQETGSYHYLQVSFAVDIPAAEVREKLTALASVRPGETLGGEEEGGKVKAVNAEDGYMFQFEDDTWILMRPSGTEPKVRIYAESRESPEATVALCELGKRVALSTLG